MNNLLIIIKSRLKHTSYYPFLLKFKSIIKKYFPGIFENNSSSMDTHITNFQIATNQSTGSAFVIEFPYREIGFPIEYYPGWYYVKNPESKIEITANGKIVPLFPLNRPDLDKPGFNGFSIYFELSKYLHLIDEKREIFFELVVDKKTEMQLKFNVAEYVIEPARDYGFHRSNRAKFLNDILQCPNCHKDKPVKESKNLVCPNCQTCFPQGDWDGITMISGSLEKETRLINKNDPVSAHVYPDTLVNKIKKIGEEGGWALDVGAGLRRQSIPNLICVELFDYPSTDVRALGESLPFRDDSFDFIVSNAVLEHVPNPFKDARELLRVLKPGGELFVTVPFLQPEHGYPHHYFNMTRAGLRQLFGDAIEIEQHFIDFANEPIFTLNWFLGVYASHLPPQDRERFLEFKVRDIINQHPLAIRDDPIIKNLSEDGKWTIACGHTLIARKRSKA
ncbi:MAG: methyltransferase domain-containing protein [Gammaproteobacteria bacterium]